MRHEERLETSGVWRGDGLQARTTPELVREFFEEGQLLLREEMHLAKVEAREELRSAARAGAALGVGGALLYCALVLLAFTLVFVGWTFLPLWASALIVTALFAISGGIALGAGKAKLKHIGPKDTKESLKEDRRWAKETIRSVKSQRHASA
jgi:hypothetical protein